MQVAAWDGRKRIQQNLLDDMTSHLPIPEENSKETISC
jgi:hypothetical protein